MISATIILDSIAENGKRLTTFELVLPKQLLAQLNTHRTLSKNVSSARAIPTKKFKQSVLETPVMPIWTMNKSGMVGTLADFETSTAADEIWLETRDLVIQQVDKLVALGIHKQTANRLLEPWFYAKIVCSATDLEWFYFLRDTGLDGSAQNEIAMLARKMRKAQDASTPKVLKPGEWHIPYILPEEESLDLETKLKISVARCARVSYKTHDNDLLSTIEKDLKLYTQLFEEKHLSPFEHQATPAQSSEYRKSNFTGWVQNRQTI